MQYPIAPGFEGLEKIGKGRRCLCLVLVNGVLHLTSLLLRLIGSPSGGSNVRHRDDVTCFKAVTFFEIAGDKYEAHECEARSTRIRWLVVISCHETCSFKLQCGGLLLPERKLVVWHRGSGLFPEVCAGRSQSELE